MDGGVVMGAEIVYPITPVPAPRMTRRDRWAKRPCVLRYWEFRDEVRLRKVVLPDRCHVVFVMPMPASWRDDYRYAMRHSPHTKKPDIDNLLKALLDAVFANDAHIHTIRAEKIWGERGEIRVGEL